MRGLFFRDRVMAGYKTAGRNGIDLVTVPWYDFVFATILERSVSVDRLFSEIFKGSQARIATSSSLEHLESKERR